MEFKAESGFNGETVVLGAYVTGAPLQAGQSEGSIRGTVFDDANRNGIQDDGERGLGGVRVATTRGLTATTDAYGRFHITCAVTPSEGRGSNFALKLDDRTLPSGYRPSTRPVLVERATRGKTLKFNFGASIHRVVGLDVADAVFVV